MQDKPRSALLKLKRVWQMGLVFDLAMILTVFTVVVGQFCWLSLAKKQVAASQWQMLCWTAMSAPTALLPFSTVIVVLALLRCLQRLRRQSASLAMQSLGLGRWHLARVLGLPLLIFIMLAVFIDAYWAPQLKRQVAFETHVGHTSALYADQGGYWLQLEDAVVHIRALLDHQHWSGVSLIKNPHKADAWMLTADDVWYSQGQWLAFNPKISAMDAVKPEITPSWLPQSVIANKAVLPTKNAAETHSQNMEMAVSTVVLPIKLKPRVLGWAKTKANQLNLWQLVYMLRHGQTWGFQSLGSWLNVALRLSMPFSALLACLAVFAQLSPIACPRSQAWVRPTVIIIVWLILDFILRLLAESWVLNQLSWVVLIQILLLAPWVGLMLSKR